ncbi:MAG: hypothetical protein JNK12_09375 [Acidimicrobiales bacterium]|nr:hypothetical protein [Acidimicrobiales bacterium]
MASTHVVVDGSNIATEGRSTPSLKQLDEAVRAFLEEHPHDKLTVVVDATFGHRIDPSERALFDEAIANNEMVTPPAGAIGRGDAFVLEIAERAGALILSNDSFQEFHGTHPWLFDEGRLIGGKPVPDVGWVFVSRSPVRGATSQRAVRDARKRNSRAAEPAEAPAGRGRSSSRSSSSSASGRGRSSSAAETTNATEDSAAGPSTGSRRSRGGRGRGGRGGDSGAGSTTQETAKSPAKQTAAGTKSSGRSQAKAEPAGNAPAKRASVNKTNDPLPFIEFVANYPVGSTVSGEVEQFSSHGAYVLAGGARCYVALKALGDPPPRSARDVLERGEVRDFVVLAFDTPRRGIDLIVPGLPNTPAPPSAEEASPKAASARRAATQKATEGAPRTGAAPLKSQRGGDGVQDTAPATKKKGGIAEAAKKLIGRKK